MATWLWIVIVIVVVLIALAAGLIVLAGAVGLAGWAVAKRL